MTLSKKRKYLFIVGFIVLLCTTVGIWANATWKQFKTTYGITYEELDWSLGGTIAVSELHFTKDDLGHGYIDSLFLNISIIDAVKGKISAEKLLIKNAELSLIASQSDEELNLPKILATAITIDNVKLHYHNTDSILEIESGQLKLINLQVSDGYYIDSLAWTNGKVKTFEEKKDVVASEPGSFQLADLPQFSLQRLNIQNLQTSYVGDSNTVSIENIRLQNASISNTSELSLAFDTLSFSLADTLPIKLGVRSTHWAQNDSIKSKQLNLGVPGVKIKLNSLSLEPGGNFTYRVALAKSELSFGALAFWLPSMRDIMNQDLPKDSTIRISGVVLGSKSELHLENLNLQFLQNTSLSMNGLVNWEKDQGHIDLAATQLTTSRKDLQDFLAPMAYNDFFSWPTYATGTALIQGDFSNYHISGDLNSTQGKLRVQTLVKLPNEEDLYYEIKVESPQVVVSGLVDYLPLEISTSTLNTTIAGLLTEKETRDTFKLQLQLNHCQVEGYELQKLELDYYYNNQYDSLWAMVLDTAIALDFKAGFYSQDTSELRYAGRIHHAIPGLMDSIIPHWMYKGNFQGTYTYTEDDYFGVQAILQDNSMNWTNNSFQNLNEIFFKLQAQADDYSVAYKSGPNSATAQFRLPNKRGAELSISEFIKVQPNLNLQAAVQIDSAFAHQLTNIDFNIAIQNLDVAYNSGKRAWNISAQIPVLGYEAGNAENLTISYVENDEKTDGQITIENVNYGDISIHQFMTSLSNYNENYLWETECNNINNLGPTSVHVIQQITKKYHLFKFIEGDSLTVAGNKWSIVQNEGLKFNKDYKILGGNLRLKQGSSLVQIASNNLGIMNFEVDSLGLYNMLSPILPDLNIDGQLFGTGQYNVSTNEAIFDAKLNDVILDSNELGEWELKGDYKTGKFNGHISNASSEGKSTAHISYSNSVLDYTIAFQNFNLSALDNQLQQYEFTLKGYLNGAIKGQYSDELANSGWLQVNRGTFSFPYLQTKLNLDQDSVFFEDNAIVFKNYKVRGPDGSLLKIDGHAAMYPHLDYHISLLGDNYDFLDQTNGNVISGNAKANVDLEAFGNRESGTVKGHLDILPNANIRCVLPDDVSAKKREGDVIFVSFEEVDSNKVLEKSQGQNLNLDIQFTLNKSDFEIILNPVTQEYVKIIAEGSVDLSKQGHNSPILFGSITSNSGRSRIDLPLVPPANLDIKKAEVRWTGAMDNPSISFIGVEEFKSSLEGIEKLGNRTDLVPIELEIKLDNAKVSNLYFQFDLSSTDTDVQNFLAGSTQEDRRIMATNLLLFGTLMQGASDGSSKTLDMYTAKLNEISNRNLKNTDLVFDVAKEKHYNEAGAEVEQTKLHYSLRRGFYHDRLFISVGGDLGLYSNDPSNSSASSHFIGNVNLEYQLIDDSPWIVRATRQELYEGIIDGDIVEYTLGIGFYKSYPTFGSIFQFGNNKAVIDEEE